MSYQETLIMLNGEVAAVMDVDVTMNQQESKVQQLLNVMPELGPLNPPKTSHL